MRHMASAKFAFHTVNCHFRERCASQARQFVRQLPCGWDSSKVAGHLAKCDPKALAGDLLRFTKTIPNTPQFFKAHRKNLYNTIDELGPPTLFATASAAGTCDPHLRKLIADWNGLAGTRRDPFVPNLTPSEVRGRRNANLHDFAAVASWFWDKKAALVRDRLLPRLGIIASWERTEYQCRGSCHGHALW